MIKPFENEDQEEGFQKFLEHFPANADITLMVLKGHLLAEEEINEILNFFSHNTKELEKTDLTFFQKICLLRALLPSKMHKTFYAAEMLNRLRNKIAHNLKPKGLEDSIKNFLLSIDKSYKKTMSSEATKTHLGKCLARLHGGLVGYKHGLGESNLSHIITKNI